MSNQIAPLTVAEAKRLIDNYRRIGELANQRIVTEAGTAEANALKQEFAAGVLNHSGELLECFMMVKTEYEIILHAESIRLRRAAEINARQMQRQMKQADDAGKVPQQEAKP